MRKSFNKFFSENWKFLVVAIPGIIAVVFAAITYFVQKRQLKLESTSVPNMYIKTEKVEMLPSQIAEDLASKYMVITSAKRFQGHLIFEPVIRKLDRNLIKKFKSALDSLKIQFSKEYKELISPYMKPLELRIMFSNLGKMSYIVERINVFEKGYLFEVDLYGGGHISPKDITDSLHFSKSPPFQIPADQAISIIIEFPVRYSRRFIESQIRFQERQIRFPDTESSQENIAQAMQIYQEALDIFSDQYEYEIRAILSNGLTISRGLKAKESFSKKNLFQFLKEW